MFHFQNNGELASNPVKTNCKNSFSDTSLRIVIMDLQLIHSETAK